MAKLLRSKFTMMTRNLHIGGTSPSAGWEILNAIPAEYVDHVGNANDLSRFADGTFSKIYASHVVEHLDYSSEIAMTLAEWRRTLQPGGSLYISVPDMDILAGLFLEKNLLNLEERFMVMRMIFGGHIDAFDYHLTGLNEEFLSEFLKSAGYTSITRVESLKIFHDTSEMEFKGVRISLNVRAKNPENPV
ncbi:MULTISPECIES: class I SAM-dependent methyltransferase [Synechococcales]|uniref:class I SAM-dependent methyltransferase n=1 Tax=unclassified Synechococcus TaxID=2626047 RepID=UPI0021A54FAE|nr:MULTISPECIES: methyltransferase domain-containing protein [unclassified Synechococcus]MCT0212101.1 methyltransferase domain-containing protein [Synechococcus sp. CS-1326]MCT0234222.1 methyltransferase domain-containing protein [Synechococcus sp. CS-1327]